MADTCTLISTVSVGVGGAASIDFTSIPQTYTDLLLVFSLRGDANGAGGIRATNEWKFNSSSSGYTSRWLYGIPGIVSSSATSTETYAYGGYFNSSSATANAFGSGQMYIPNYTGSQYKTWSIDGVSESHDTSTGLSLGTGVWSNSSAITSITLLGDYASGNMAQYSTASLYGIKKS